MNSSSEVLKNNSVAITKRDIFGNHGIVCASSSTEEEVRIDWYSPRNAVIEVSDALYTSSALSSSTRQQKELLASGTFRSRHSGIYTCIVNISNSFIYLYLGLYTGYQELNEVILNVSNSGGALVFSCYSNGLPAEDVHWYLDNQMVAGGIRTTIITDRSTSAYRTDLTLHSRDITINGTECLKCQVIANGTNEANSSCYMTDVIGMNQT